MFGPADAVIAITEFPPDFEVTDSAVVVRARAGRADLPAHGTACVACAAVWAPRWSWTSFAVQTGLDVAPLAARLLQEGLCAEMTEALWWGCTGLVPTAA